MSLSNRIEKLEAASLPPASVWLRIITREGDTDDVIDRLKAEAIDRWKRDNPDKETPVNFNFINRVLVKPMPRINYG